MSDSLSPAAGLTGGALVGLLLAVPAGAQPIESPSRYLDDVVERRGETGGAEDEIDAGEAQAEARKQSEPTPGLSKRAARQVEAIVVRPRLRLGGQALRLSTSASQLRPFQ